MPGQLVVSFVLVRIDLAKLRMFSMYAIGVSSMSLLEFDSRLLSVLAVPRLISF